MQTMINDVPSPSKLRRKVSVEDALENVASIQRLVEYFVIISCHPKPDRPVHGPVPNYGTSNQQQQQQHPPSPNPSRAEMRRGVSAPIPSVEGSASLIPTSPKSNIRRNISNVFRKSRTSVEHGLAASFSSDTQRDESREETVPPPQPRGTWKRDDEEFSSGNIYMPQEEHEECNFQPKITSRYPLRDHHDNPLNPMVTQFCHPVGDVVVPTRHYQMPRVHHFVLTNDKGRKVYGTCLTIYEEYEPPSDSPIRAQHRIHGDSGERDIEVTMDDHELTFYLPRCICILSIWPYMSAFREYLAQLYRLVTSTNCMNVPLERYIMNICMEIPAPPPGAFEVHINILDSVIRFWSPPAKLPIAYVAIPYRVLFDCLDVENILLLWCCLTMEQKVLLVSSQYSNLTVCSEILCSLLYPMKWSHLYVPLLPRFLAPMLDAPVPYLCGVTRDNWFHVQQFVSDETIVVDLDRNNIMFGVKTPSLPALPGKKWTKLRKNLEDIAGHLFWQTRGLENEYREFRSNRLDKWGFQEAARQKGEIRWNEKLSTFDQAFNLQFTPDSENLQPEVSPGSDQNQWDRVQESFLRFFVAMLKDYRHFLRIPGESAGQGNDNPGGDWLQWNQRLSFDRDAFIRSQKAEYNPYLARLTLTQQFDDFITKRLYSPEMPDIIFFDQSIDAKLNRSRLKLKKVDTPFLQSAKAHKVLKTFLAVGPCASDLELKGPFLYKNWPETLNVQLFGKPRPIPTIITAEFDRQAALVTRLRSHHYSGSIDSNRLIDFYGSDYDGSPEGMAFTVFFYAYSTVIGREWEAFQRKQTELANFYNENHDPQADEKAETDRDDPDENIEVAIASSDNEHLNLCLELCDGCPNLDGRSAVNDALIYVTTNPCPRQLDEFNLQAQMAFEAISNIANNTIPYFQDRTSSLLDNDDEFAEYEEARDVAIAQLDLAFDTLKTMESRGLLSDPDIFKSLMRACGRCGDTKRASELIQMMQRDGLAADREVLSCFMAAFAHTEELPDYLPSDTVQVRGRGSDAYSTFLRKNLDLIATESTDAMRGTSPMSDSDGDGTSDCASSSGSEISAIPTSFKHPTALHMFDWLVPRQNSTNGHKEKRRRRRRRNSLLAGPQLLSDRLVKQIVLGENLLDLLYPDLKIDTEGDSCPQCSYLMKIDNIVDGWQPRAFQDFTTRCSQCQHRFVPRFSVCCSAPTFEGSQGLGTPLFCEFLSPWVLRKELSHIIDSERGIELLLDPDFRKGTQVGATIWWNLIALFRHYKLPFSFLLQGSFQNRLINPVPQD